MTKKKRVVLGMSGGIDSCAAAYMLIEQGYEVIGIHNQYWVDPEKSSCDARASNKCCSNEGITIARKIAKELGFPFYVFDVQEEFRGRVVEYFIKSYAEGVTPNPCVVCNKFIKFGLFLDKAKELGADYVASGHYARVEMNTETGLYELFSGKDDNKDQSYFLHRLSQDQLAHCMFPLGNMNKDQVREYMVQKGAPFPEGKKESQGICFFPEKEQEEFLKRHLPPQTPGPMVSVEGAELGTHKGLAFYTIGQRQGLEIGGLSEPLYVIKKDIPNNTLVVGKNSDLLEQTITLKDVHFIGNTPEFPSSINAKIRFRSKGAPMHLTQSGDYFQGTFDTPVRAITPGQSVVFYEDEKVLGGGIIVS